MSSRQQARTASALLHATGTASTSVINARVQAFSNPASLLSPWHQSEVRRMTSEKLAAASEGLLAASAELVLLPYRALLLAARPATWTPTGWLSAWMDATGLWLGVGNAALRPAKVAAVRNRARLARSRR